MSLPSRERGLKFAPYNLAKLFYWSLPSRERGLKFRGKQCHCYQILSLPSRERGLKFFRWLQIYPAVGVAPFAGAWIEICSLTAKSRETRVAPFAGAWIEIECFRQWVLRREVAPFAGAWIEILKEPMRIFPGSSSLPSRERGLKC